MSNAIVGDIGGTNARFWLINYQDSQLQIIRQTILRTRSYQSFIHCLGDFINQDDQIAFGIFGVAGPTLNNTCHLTNAGWTQTTSGQDVQLAFNIPKIKFYNDFVIAGYGILNLQENDFIKINGPQQNTNDVKAVLGPGTGIGVCFLTKTNEEYKVWPGEGGHLPFLPQSDDEQTVYDYFVNLFKDSSEYSHYDLSNQVTLEIAAAGIGSYHCYNALKSKYPELVDAQFDNLFESANSIGEKTKLIYTNKQNEICLKALQVIFKILGYCIGNLACSYLPYGGIYIIGGIAQKNWEILSQSDILMQGIYSKPLHIREMIQNIPIYIVKEGYSPGLNGVFYLAERKFRKLMY